MADTKQELVGDVRVQITVELGRARKQVQEVLSFATGSIVELHKTANEPVDIYVNKTLFARGEVVTIDESFAARVTEVMSKEQRHNALQNMTKKG